MLFLIVYLCFFFLKKDPVGEVHLLIIPNDHKYKDVSKLTKNDIPMIEEMNELAKKISNKLKPKQEFEFVFVQPPFNTVFHLHLHAISLPKKHQSGWFKHLAL